MMPIQTARLTIRLLREADIESVHHLHSVPETDTFNTLGIPDSIQTSATIVAEWLAAGAINPRISYVCCIELKDTDQFIGLIALHLAAPKFSRAEVWYKIHVSYWNQGYATEALTGILDFGFNQLKIHRIEAGCAVENIASAKVLEKAGMIKEGMKRRNLPIRGEWVDSFSYAVLEETYIR
jgi:[ribosomal protein S5]-alanine N-acetyltransferase